MSVEKYSSLKLSHFAKTLFSQMPMTFFLIGFLYLTAGALELLSLAALLPVLMGLLEVATQGGFAQKLISSIGIDSINVTTALVYVLAFMSIRGLLLFFADYWVARIACKLEIQTKNRLFNSLIYSNWQYLLSLDNGNLSNLILRETERYSVAIRRLAEFMSSVLIAGILILFSVFVSWQAFVIFVLAVCPYLIIAKFLQKRVQKNSALRVFEANHTGRQIGENAGQLKYIKAAGMENLVGDKFRASVNRYGSYFLNIIFFKSFIKHFPEVLGVAVLGGLIIFAKNYIGENPSDIVFFLLLLFRGYRQLANVQSILAIVLENVPSYQICEDIIADALGKQEEFADRKAIPASINSIILEGVGYSYNDNNNTVLSNISLELPSNGLIAFAGPSGAGKSTLADILLGLIEPQSGQISINKTTALNTLNLQEWRQSIGYVPQDPFLVSGSIRNNILIGAEDVSDENLTRAAKAARVTEFVEGLPARYETDIGEFGARLSGGQKQRIALARALAKKPKFLILDEATSALDSNTEREIQESIETISDETLVIVIAHRLSTIRNADCIYVLENGELIEQGDYDTLINKQGLFADLHARR